MGRIKIKDLNVDLEDLKKRDPEVLRKITGGGMTYVTASSGGRVQPPTQYGVLVPSSFIQNALGGCAY